MNKIPGLVCGLFWQGTTKQFTMVHLPALPPIGGAILLADGSETTVLRVTGVMLHAEALTLDRIAAMQERAEASGKMPTTMQQSAMIYVEREHVPE